jgi:hypothetical protein
VSALADWTAAAVPIFPPSVSSATAPVPIPFGSCLSSLVPSSSCRTQQRPSPRPLEIHRRLGTPSRRAIFSAPPPPAIFGENPATPPCPVQPSSLPRGVPAGCATPRPPAGPPCRRACGHRAVTALITHAQHRLEWVGWATVLLGHANSARPRAEMSAQHCAVIFLFLFFI